MINRSINHKEKYNTMMEILLTQGKSALVDDADYESLAQFKWYAWKAKNGSIFYARRHVIKPDGSRGCVFMHQVLCQVFTDHIDGDGLNNQRHNLRPASSRENSFNRRKRIDNTSGFRGVTWNKRAQKWQSQIAVHGKTHYLGLFVSAKEAALARDAAAIRLHGEFARLNFPKASAA